MKRRNYGVVIDWETSGILDQHVPWQSYLEGPQGIEIGVVTVELPSFSPIAEFSCRVRFLGAANGVSYGGPRYEGLTWDHDAERVHGLTPHELLAAEPPVIVAAKLVRFVTDSARIEDSHKMPLMICGHNVAGDAYYLRQLLYLGQVEQELRFHHRMLDSFTMGHFLFGARSSNELFRLTGGAARGTHHRALDDARLTQQAFRSGYETCLKAK